MLVLHISKLQRNQVLTRRVAVMTLITLVLTMSVYGKSKKTGLTPQSTLILYLLLLGQEKEVQKNKENNNVK